MQKTHRGGAKTKCTPETIKRVVAVLKRGTPQKAAALCAGIAPETFYRWMNKGEADPVSRYGAFRFAVLEAEADIYRRMSEHHTDLVEATEDPDAVLNWLKAHHPEDLSEARLTKKIETTGANGGPIEQRVTMAESVALTLVQEALSVPGMEAARQAIAEKFAKAAQAPVVVDPEDEDSDEE